MEQQVNSFLKRKKAKNDLAIPFTKGIPKFPPKFPKIPISPPNPPQIRVKKWLNAIPPLGSSYNVGCCDLRAQKLTTGLFAHDAIIF